MADDEEAAQYLSMALQTGLPKATVSAIVDLIRAGVPPAKIIALLQAMRG